MTVSVEKISNVKLQLCWFRTDLRIHNNPALSNALASGPTLAIYIATPTQWQLHDDAAIKLDFWRRNLAELKTQLGKRNVDLLFFQVAEYKDIPELLHKMLSSFKVAHLHYNREYPLNETRRDALVDAACAQQGVAVSSFRDQLLVSPQEALNQSGSAFKVFTPFARKVLGQIQSDTALYDRPDAPRGNTTVTPPVEPLEEQRDLANIDWPHPNQQWEQDWPAGEAAATSQMEEFAQNRIADYKLQRDIPSIESSSQISAYLNCGVISVAECWRAAQKYYDNSGVETWRNELLWREFYRHTVYHFPHVCTHRVYRESASLIPWRHDVKDFESWCLGRTGYPLVDAGMRQLASSGWMHNRLRMVTAMFLSKHLLIDWRWGERWFMQHLIDGDFASNNGGWQWSASTGVDAAPYFRIFNPTRQSQRFDAEGAYIHRHVPELTQLRGKYIHEPADSCPADYPSPIVEHKFARERALNAFKSSQD